MQTQALPRLSRTTPRYRLKLGDAPISENRANSIEARAASMDCSPELVSFRTTGMCNILSHQHGQCAMRPVLMHMPDIKPASMHQQPERVREKRSGQMQPRSNQHHNRITWTRPALLRWPLRIASVSDNGDRHSVPYQFARQALRSALVATDREQELDIPSVRGSQAEAMPGDPMPASRRPQAGDRH